MTEEKAVVFNVPKNYEELDFTDDFLFCKILTANLDLCRELLEIIMDIKIRKVELAESQKEWKAEYMTLLMREQEIMEKGIERGRIEGHREGRTEERNQIITHMLKKQIPIEQISDLCVVTLEEVLQIQHMMETK